MVVYTKQFSNVASRRTCINALRSVIKDDPRIDKSRALNSTVQKLEENYDYINRSMIRELIDEKFDEYREKLKNEHRSNKSEKIEKKDKPIDEEDLGEDEDLSMSDEGEEKPHKKKTHIEKRLVAVKP